MDLELEPGDTAQAPFQIETLSEAEDVDEINDSPHFHSGNLRGFRKRWLRTPTQAAGSLADVNSVPREDGSVAADDSASNRDLLFGTTGLLDDGVYDDYWYAETGPVQVCDSQSAESNWKNVAFESVTKRARATADKMPWEDGVFAASSSSDKWAGTVVSSIGHAFTPTGIGALEVIDSVTVDIIHSPPQQQPI